MIVPTNCPAARLRHSLAMSGTKQKDLAVQLGVSNARVSQMIRDTSFRIQHLSTLESAIPGFSTLYYLRGEHPSHDMVLLPTAAFAAMSPYCPGVLAQLLSCKAGGDPAATIIVLGGQVVTVMLSAGGVLVSRSAFGAEGL